MMEPRNLFKNKNKKRLLSLIFLLGCPYQGTAVDILLPSSSSSPETSTTSAATPTPPASNYLYCKVCDLSFTSIIHSTQHYEGKNHSKKLKRQQQQQQQYQHQQNQQQQQDVLDVLPDPASETSGLSPFFCQICCVNATSRPQLETHLQGKVHKMKVERLKRFPKSTQLEKEEFVKNENFSIYRTPSGQFYCSICNVCVNTESQFGQHLESRKHKQKNASQKTGQKTSRK